MKAEEREVRNDALALMNFGILPVTAVEVPRRIIIAAMKTKLEEIKEQAVTYEGAIATLEAEDKAAEMIMPATYNKDWTLEDKVFFIVTHYSDNTLKAMTKKVFAWEGGNKREWNTKIGATLTKMVQKKLLGRVKNEKNMFTYIINTLIIK